MAHFSVYDTDVTASATGTGDQNNGPPPYPAVKAEAVLTLQPTQTDFAEFITGSVETEKEGVLEVQVSFDYPKDHENEEEAISKSHWVTLENSKEGEKGKLTVKANTPQTFVFFAVAPYFRLVWTQAEASSAEKKPIEEAETKATEERVTRVAAEKVEKEKWETEETATTITKKEREEKEATQKLAREKDEAEEKVAKEKRIKELAAAGTNESLRLFARAQEKGRV